MGLPVGRIHLRRKPVSWKIVEQKQLKVKYKE